MAAEGYKATSSTAPGAVDIAVDVGSDAKEYQLQSWATGASQMAKVPVNDVDGERLPIGGPQLGATDEAAAATDTSTSGWIGLLKRIAQNFTSLKSSLSALLSSTVSTSIVIPAPINNLSGPINSAGLQFVGLVMPFASTPLTMGYRVGLTSSGTYFPLYDAAGTRISVPITNIGTGQCIPVPVEARGWLFIKVENLTGSADAPICPILLRGRNV